MNKMQIVVPELVIPVAGNAPFGLKSLIQWSINTDTRFNSTAAGIRASIRIDQAIEKLPEPTLPKPPDPDPQAPVVVECNTIELRRSDYQLLLQAVQDPQPLGDQRGYPVFPGKLLIPFIDAVERAIEIPD